MVPVCATYRHGVTGQRSHGAKSPNVLRRRTEQRRAVKPSHSSHIAGVASRATPLRPRLRLRSRRGRSAHCGCGPVSAAPDFPVSRLELGGTEDDLMRGTRSPGVGRPKYVAGSDPPSAQVPGSCRQYMRKRPLHDIRAGMSEPITLPGVALPPVVQKMRTRLPESTAARSSGSSLATTFGTR